MAKQKYDNGAVLLAISYKKNDLIKVKVVVYKPETALYQVTYKNLDSKTDLYADLPEDRLISAAELTGDDLAYKVQGSPEGWNKQQTGIYIFNADGSFHIGTINFDGKWKDYKTGSFHDDVSHYLKIADFPGNKDDEEDIMAYEMTISAEPPKIVSAKS
jgi:hypothetical protein